MSQSQFPLPGRHFGVSHADPRPYSIIPVNSQGYRGIVFPDRLDFSDPDTTTTLSTMLRSDDTNIQIQALTQYADALKHAHRHFEGPLGLLLDEVVAICRKFLTVAPEQASALPCWTRHLTSLAT
jgi:hypothetical protein